jgi:site-specific DNA recombinase
MSRVLGRVRLSHDTDESTSVVRQREDLERWAQAHGYEIVGWAQDVDISGSVDNLLSTKTELGRWLRGRRGEFDIIAAAKLDRLQRDTIALSRLVTWCHDHDVKLIAVGESIDFSTEMGRLQGSILGYAAAMELHNIKARTTASRAKLRELGRWPGGKIPYGYRRCAHPSGVGYALAPDPQTSEVVGRIVSDLLDGASLSGICRQLEAEHVPAPRGGTKWAVTPLRKLLRSTALLGRSARVSYGDDGMPIQYGPEIVEKPDWDLVQARLDGHIEARKDARRSEQSPLSGLLRCRECGTPMQHDLRVTKRNGTEYPYRYYRSRCRHISIRAEKLEDLAEQFFMAGWGDIEVTTRRWVPGSSNEAETKQAIEAIDSLSAIAGTMTSQTAKDRLAKQLASLDQRLSELEAMPSTEGRWVEEPTGATYRDVGFSRDLLLDHGFTFRVGRHEDGDYLVDIEVSTG